MSSDIHNRIIYAKDIDARIAELREITVRYARDMDEGETGELAALLDFRATVVGQYGVSTWDADISFVSDEFADGYYQEWESFALEDALYWTDGER